MASPLHLSCSRTYPVPADRAYELTLAWPLAEVFGSRFGPIPPITGTDQVGEWGTVDQVRTIHTGDGGTMAERLVLVDAPNEFRYVITDVTGPMKPLAARIEGSWKFDPVGSGCRITWSWTVHGASAAAGVGLPVFGKLWRGYARRALDHLEGLLLEAAYPAAPNQQG